jgi:hypothetical protein
MENTQVETGLLEGHANARKDLQDSWTFLEALLLDGKVSQFHTLTKNKAQLKHLTRTRWKRIVQVNGLTYTNGEGIFMNNINTWMLVLKTLQTWANELIAIEMCVVVQATTHYSFMSRWASSYLPASSMAKKETWSSSKQLRFDTPAHFFSMISDKVVGLLWTCWDAFPCTGY